MGFLFDYPPRGVPTTSQQIREQFNKLGDTNYTTDASSPSNPRVGMQRTYQATPTSDILLQMWIGSSWRTIAFVSSGGGVAASRVDRGFSSSTLWTFPHGLGRYMQVYCLDSTGAEIYPTVAQPDVNTVTASHSVATSGTIILVG